MRSTSAFREILSMHIMHRYRRLAENPGVQTSQAYAVPSQRAQGAPFCRTRAIYVIMTALPSFYIAAGTPIPSTHRIDFKASSH